MSEDRLNPDNLVTDETTSIQEEIALSNEDLDTREEIPVSEPEADPLAAAKAEVESYKDQLLRLAAEFENYKKRTQREYNQLVQYANEKLILELLPVVDDLERILKSPPDLSEDEKVKSFVQAVEMIYQKMLQTLGRQGLKAMESIGQTFNVDLHDALMQTDAPGKETNTIIDEFEKGYWLHDKVLRHAKVIVAK